jgi:hypothetical protein
MEETFKVIGHVTNLISCKNSSRPQGLAVVEAKSIIDAAAAVVVRLVLSVRVSEAAKLQYWFS